MATLTEQKSRKEYKCSSCGNKIEKGIQYLRFALTRFSKMEPRCMKCRPKPSEMTQSDFLSQVYEIDERIQAMDYDSIFEDEIQEIVSELDTLRDECEEKRDNMPEQLQDSEVGMLLEGRGESVQEMIDELEGIDTDVPTIDDLKQEDEKEDDESEEEYEERMEQELEGKKQEILDEIQGVCYNGE